MSGRSYTIEDFERASDLLDSCIEKACRSREVSPGPGPGLGNIDYFIRALKYAKSADKTPQRPDSMEELIEAYHLSGGSPGTLYLGTMYTRDRLTMAAWYGGVAAAWAKTAEQHDAWRTTHQLIELLTDLADRVGQDYIDPYYT